jgi:hypothetical protein
MVIPSNCVERPEPFSKTLAERLPIWFATRYTRHLNRFGYLRIQGWKL